MEGGRIFLFFAIGLRLFDAKKVPPSCLVSHHIFTDFCHVSSRAQGPTHLPADRHIYKKMSALFHGTSSSCAISYYGLFHGQRRPSDCSILTGSNCKQDVRSNSPDVLRCLRKLVFTNRRILLARARARHKYEPMGEYTIFLMVEEAGNHRFSL